MGLNRKLALVVEDDPLQRDALSELLRERDFDVVHCESAEAGELVLRKMGPELSVLVTDVILSGKRTGVQLAVLARTHLPNLKIIVISGKNIAQPSDTHLLQKPWLPDDLLRLLAL